MEGQSDVPVFAAASPAVRSLQGRFRVDPLEDGRLFRLVLPYTLVDRDGKTWRVPRGIVFDGASIPQFLWSIIGGPMEGKYRNSSAIHDFLCEIKITSSSKAAAVFYDGMIANNENELKARMMYAAVKFVGPKFTATNLRAINRTSTKVVAAASRFSSGVLFIRSDVEMARVKIASNLRGHSMLKALDDAAVSIAPSKHDSIEGALIATETLILMERRNSSIDQIVASFEHAAEEAPPEIRNSALRQLYMITCLPQLGLLATKYRVDLNFVVEGFCPERRAGADVPKVAPLESPVSDSDLAVVRRLAARIETEDSSLEEIDEMVAEEISRTKR